MLKTTIEAAVLTLVLAGGVTTCNAVEPSGKEPPRVGDKAQDFALHDIQGNHFSLNDTFKTRTGSLSSAAWLPRLSMSVLHKAIWRTFFESKEIRRAWRLAGFRLSRPAPELNKFAKEFIGTRSYQGTFIF